MALSAQKGGHPDLSGLPSRCNLGGRGSGIQKTAVLPVVEGKDSVSKPDKPLLQRKKYVLQVLVD